MSEEKKNEVATKDQNTAISTENMFNTEVTAEDQEAFSGDLKWIPSLSIAYPSAPIVAEGKARPGEFVLSGKEALGNSIDVIVLSFRHHVAYQDPSDGYKQKEHFYFKKGQGNIKKDPGYIQFCKDLPAGMKLLEGPDMFVFVPQVNQFAVFFMKNTLKYSANDLISAGEAGRLVNVTTVLTKGKKHSYYLVTSVPKGSAASNSPIKDPTIQKCIDIPKDRFLEFAELFDNPSKGIEQASEEAEQFDR